MSGSASVSDNWYAIRAISTGVVLAVGWWMPPDIEGVATERVDADTARRLLDELKARVG